MSSRKQRLGVAAAMTLSGGILFAGPGTSCTSFLLESALDAVDFCFVFDCQNGILGGTIQPCGPFDNFSQDALNSPPTGPVFIDCPDLP